MDYYVDKDLICKDCIYRKYDVDINGTHIAGFRWSMCAKYISKPKEVVFDEEKCEFYRKQKSEPLVWADESKGKNWFTELLKQGQKDK